MPRDSNGIYTLPAGNPVITGLIIESAWANSTMPDLGNEITDSLSRSGEGGMLAQFKKINGTAGAPADTWTSEITSGWYRAASGDFRFSITGGDIFRVVAAGLQLWDGASWVPIGGSNVFPGNNPDLLGVNAAIAIGGNDPDLDPHIEIGPSNIQAKADATSVDTLTINAIGGEVVIGSSPSSYTVPVSGNHEIRVNDFDAMEITNGTIFLFAPSLAPQVSGVNFMDSSKAYMGFAGFENTDDMIFQNFNDGGDMIFIVDDDAGTPQGVGFITGDLYGEVSFVGASFNALNASSSSGVDMSTNTCALIVGTADPDNQGHIAFDAGNIQAKDDVSTVDQLTLNPYGGTVQVGRFQDDHITVSSSGIVLSENDTSDYAQTIAPASGGFEVNNQLTGSGLERALTESDLLSMPVEVDTDTETLYTLQATDLGRTVICTGSGDVDIGLPDTLPIGWWCNVISLTSGTVDIVSAGTTFIRYPADGTSELAEDMSVTVWQYDDAGATAWWKISGQTIPV